MTSGSLAGTMRPSRRLRALLSLAATTLATTGFTCGPSGPPLPEPSHRCAPLAPPDDGMPAVEIGTGEGEGFVPVAGPLAREYGPQGGSHVTLTLHLFADAGERWEYDLTLLRDEETVGAGGLPVKACPGAWVESTHVRLFLYEEGPIEGTLRLEARPEGMSESDVVFELPVEVE